MFKQNLYKIVVVGPTGAGKSQFCNFIQKDLTNSINRVSDSLDSCTQDPFSNYFKRQENNFEFIDTAGNSDSSARVFSWAEGAFGVGLYDYENWWGFEQNTGRSEQQTRVLLNANNAWTG